MINKGNNLNNDIINLSKSLAVGLCCGILAIIALLFVSSMIISKVDTPHAILSTLTTFVVGIGAFISSFICGMIQKSRGIIIGFICGLIISVMILLIGVSVFKSPFSSTGLLKAIVIMCSSLIGGIIGVNFKLKRKF